MKSLRNAAQQEGKNVPISLKSLMEDYGTNSLRTLFVGIGIHQREVTSADLPGGYQLTIEQSGEKYSLRIMANDGSSPSGLDVPSSEEKSEQAIKEIGKETFKYFQQKGEDIANGKIKAAEIGAAIYGIAGYVILAIFAPFAAAGTLLAKVFNSAFSISVENIGEYYGAIVDDFVAILKNESALTVSEVVGTMGTLVFSQIIFDYPGGPLRFLGIDGWSLTKKVGKEVGGVLEDAIDEVEFITGIDIGDVASDVEEFFNDIF
jgi:hypothetical protein